MFQNYQVRVHDYKQFWTLALARVSAPESSGEGRSTRFNYHIKLLSRVCFLAIVYVAPILSLKRKLTFHPETDGWNKYIN